MDPITDYPTAVPLIRRADSVMHLDAVGTIRCGGRLEGDPFVSPRVMGVLVGVGVSSGQRRRRG